MVNTHVQIVHLQTLQGKRHATFLPISTDYPKLTTLYDNNDDMYQFHDN